LLKIVLKKEQPEKVWWHLRMGNCKRRGLLCWTWPRELLKNQSLQLHIISMQQNS